MRCFATLALLTLAGADQSSFSSGVAELQNSLQTLSLSGQNSHAGLASGRRLIVESMLTTAEKALPEKAKTILRNVSALLQTILDDLISDHDLDVEQLNSSVSFGSCVNDEQVTAGGVLEEAANTLRTEHVTCREQEALLFTDDSTKCRDMSSLLQGMIPQDCDFGGLSVTDVADRQTIHTKLSDNAGWFTANHKSFKTLSADCQDADALLTAKTSECNTDFTNFETKVCEFADHRHVRCAAEQNCYTGHKNHYESQVGDLRENGNQRTKDAQMITYLQCLVDKLILDQGDFAAWTAACEPLKSNDYQNYNITITDFPDKEVCDLIASYPGATTWETDEYSTIDAVKSPVPDTDYACVFSP